MSRSALWTIILGGLTVTYLIRLSFTVMIPHERMPTLFRRGLTYVPPAVLAAIILPELVRPDGPVDLSLGNDPLLAGLLAAIVAWRTGNVWFTILVGMAALWALGLR